MAVLAMALLAMAVLATAALPGSLALPSLAKLAAVLGGAPHAAWQQGEHLPVEIGLPAELRFHSVATRPANRHPNP